MNKILAKLIMLPMRLDVWRARFWMWLAAFSNDRVQKILDQYDQK